MTNLDLETAEELQIANYGIGGHYDPHFDFATDKVKTDKDLIDGNRVATVLFYVRNITQLALDLLFLAIPT